jgi:hypothetical protein
MSTASSARNQIGVTASALIHATSVGLESASTVIEEGERRKRRKHTQTFIVDNKILSNYKCGSCRK